MFEEKIEGDYIVRKYPNGAEVRTLISQETEGQVIELPKNPILALQEENVQLKSQIDSLNIAMANIMGA